MTARDMWDTAIRGAWGDAQSAFHAMIEAGVYSDPNAPETRAYVEAERALDVLLAGAQAIYARRDNPMDGDHHVYPNGVGR